MAPRVLYFCPCTLAADLSSAEPSLQAGPSAPASLDASPSKAASERPSGPVQGKRATTVVDAIPPLPCYDRAAQYSHFTLENLYFCEECDQIKCKRCTTAEVSSYYCSVCLFDAQAANVKADRNRCSRSCFLCPSCSHSLQVVGMVPNNSADQPKLAQGEAPFFMSCSFCRWDSKEIGMTFERSSGLSLQLQRKDEQSYDFLELQHLIQHFDTFYKAQGVSESHPSSNELSSRQRAALSAAAKSSKLLRDVPILSSETHSRYMLGTNRYKQSDQPRAAPDDISDYRTVTSYNSGRDPAQPDSLGVIGRAEDFKERWLSQNTNFANTTTLGQKWATSSQQSVRTRELRPLRAPLKTKLTKRCTDCSHILIRPDVKATTPRFKIKLVAVNFLPAIQVLVAPMQAAAAGDEQRASTSGRGNDAASRIGKRMSMMGLYGTRRPQNFITSSGRGDTSSILGTRSTTAVDPERLQPGRTYRFECTFSNPLEDAMKVRISVVKPAYTMGNAADASSTEQSAWQVAPTTSQFELAASSMLNIDDEEELLGDSRRSGADDDDDDDEFDDDDDLLDEADEDDLSDAEGAGRKQGRLGGEKGRKRRNRNGGIIRKVGNTTTIGLDAVLGKEAAGDIEVAMRVTFSYEGIDDQGGPTTGSAPNGEDSLKSFTFWTAIRLGFCVDRAALRKAFPTSAHDSVSAQRHVSREAAESSAEGLPTPSDTVSTLDTIRAAT
ncbi:hypothetical protein K437DRAFT_272521 [Tilletiaria anomala UBC 951]|uniref:Dynactin subunit 4 n=1 Tax=Tilletiaria anomala (strain ATCC 24038 / CBS 436.72 / UBC 951) TaxID=1037660 RepID=A0A066WMS8_TILAU|nr:uncharacterized protein K437DRAFT_272521 [Tilletiaria anomala UBC 951]KDN52304.1 hypothetical protein K437DRAFT_272521 [Tilletiaria anomala UBC 951]